MLDQTSLLLRKGQFIFTQEESTAALGYGCHALLTEKNNFSFPVQLVHFLFWPNNAPVHRASSKVNGSPSQTISVGPHWCSGSHPCSKIQNLLRRLKPAELRLHVDNAVVEWRAATCRNSLCSFKASCVMDAASLELPKHTEKSRIIFCWENTIHFLLCC